MSCAHRCRTRLSLSRLLATVLDASVLVYKKHTHQRTHPTPSRAPLVSSHKPFPLHAFAVARLCPRTPLPSHAVCCSCAIRSTVTVDDGRVPLSNTSSLPSLVYLLFCYRVSPCWQLYSIGVTWSAARYASFISGRSNASVAPSSFAS